MQQVARWIQESGLTRSEVARRAGVARTTLDRIEGGQVGALWSTLEEIAIACGRSIDIVDRPLSDPAAAEAARLLLEADYTPSDQRGTRRWVKRLERMVPDLDPVTVLQRAGHASTVYLRRDVISLIGNATDVMVAAAGDGSKGRYALSGAPGLQLHGPIILWAEKPGLAARLLEESLERTPPNTSADVTVYVTPAPAALFAGAFRTDRGIYFAAPIQIMLDSIGLGDQMEIAAINEVRSW